MAEKKVTDSIWFSEMGSSNIIGIVKVDTGFGIKYYIGTASGENIKDDEVKIMEKGAHFSEKAGKKLF